MERIGVIGPALFLVAIMVVAFVVFSIRCALGRPPSVTGLDRRRFSDLIGPFLTRYLLWLLHPVEQFLLAARVSPNELTFAGLGASLGSGVSIATGHMATAAWLFIFSGMLDILDGRLARATNRCSKAGAFLDTVADRWGELCVFSGFAWFLRDSTWLLAALLAIAGSIMVSYVRAAGEARGVTLDGGTMQRAERIMLVSIGTLVTAWFGAAPDTVEYVPHVIGISLLLVGAASTVTAVRRWVDGYRMLRTEDEDAATLGAVSSTRTAR